LRQKTKTERNEKHSKFHNLPTYSTDEKKYENIKTKYKTKIYGQFYNGT
jgi:hypothetical protein